MIKIDSHQHFWKYNFVEYDWIDDSMKILKQDFLPDQLAQNLKLVEFEGSIAVQARQNMEETRWLLKLAENNSIVKGVVGWVDLRSESLSDQLDEFGRNSFLVGIRHVVQDEPDNDFILQPDFLRGIRLLQHYNLTYDILIFEKHLLQSIEFVKKFPNQIFVLDHIAKPKIKENQLSPWKEHIKKLAELPNVYCKLSGMVTEADVSNWSQETFRPYLDVVTKAFGVDRLMIGSDWPVCLLGGTYLQIMSIVMDFFKDFSADEKEKIFGLNAVDAYGLKI